MPKNQLDYKFLRRQVDELISLNPIHVQMWVLLAGDGFTTYNSWNYSWSWVGIQAPTGREVFRGFGTDAGYASAKNFVILIPYVSGAPIPQPNQEIRLYAMDGTRQHRFRVNFVQPYRADTANVNLDTTFAIEIHGERIEG